MSRAAGDAGLAWEGDTKQLLDAAVINLLCNQYKSVRDLHVKVSDSVLCL